MSDKPRPPDFGDDPDGLGEVSRLLAELPPAAWEGIPARPRRGPLAMARASWTRPAPVRRLRTVPTLSAAFGVFALGVLLGALVLGGRSPAPTPVRPVPATGGQTVVLRPLDAPSDASASATMLSAGQMVLTAQHLPVSAPGTYYELWLMTNLRQLAPVSSFRVTDHGSVRLDVVLPDDPHHYAYLDISLQRIGAGTSHSAVNVLRGAIT